MDELYLISIDTLEMAFDIAKKEIIGSLDIQATTSTILAEGLVKYDLISSSPNDSIHA